MSARGTLRRFCWLGAAWEDMMQTMSLSVCSVIKLDQVHEGDDQRQYESIYQTNVALRTLRTLLASS